MQGLPLQQSHCDQVCTAIALAERQVTKATSLIAKFNMGGGKGGRIAEGGAGGGGGGEGEKGGMVDLLCTTGRATVTSDAERQRVLRLLHPTYNPSLESEFFLPRPQVRVCVCVGVCACVCVCVCVCGRLESESMFAKRGRARNHHNFSLM